MLYSQIFNALSLFFAAIGILGSLFLSIILVSKVSMPWIHREKINAMRLEQKIMRLCLPFIAGSILALTMQVFAGRIEKVVFYADKYDIVALSDKYNLAEYTTVSEDERERFVIERLGYGERALSYLHEDTMRAVSERNQHKGYEEYLK